MNKNFDSKLILEDRSLFLGKSFGSDKQINGEVVFNTGMVGYTESLTDPSYKGQILCQTHPLVGNYGVSTKDYESSGIKVSGYIIHELCKKPSHWSSEKGLDTFLKEKNIPGIWGIDTRALTKKLREKGVMRGILDNSGKNIEELKEQIKNIPDPNQRDLVSEVTTREVVTHGEGKRVVVLDCGMKRSILHYLLKNKLEVIQMPASSSMKHIMSYSPKGILISNGPGDPKKVPYLISNVKSLIEYKIPMMGICLGTQIIALALGGDTYKLKFGHRGQNHGCVDKKGRCYIISQNHGYAVSPNLPENIEVSFVNTDDGTIEGISHKTLPLFAVQFHPEAAPGPTDTRFLFDKFVKEMKYAEI